MARGTPVVATDGSALTEVVGPAGLLFPAGDVDALVVELQRVIDDETLRAELQRKGKARARELTWEASARDHVRAFELAASRYPVPK